MPVAFVTRFELSCRTTTIESLETKSLLKSCKPAQRKNQDGQAWSDSRRCAVRSNDVGRRVCDRAVISAHLHHDATHGLVVRGHVEVDAWQCHVLSCCGKAS